MESMESLVGPLFPLSFFVLLGIERVASPKRQPSLRWWTGKGVGFFLMGAAINAAVPPLIGPRLATYAPLDLSVLGVMPGALVVVLATSFADYWVHRAMHRYHFLWRWTHQMHHASERVDLPGFAISHPFELVVSVLMATVVGSLAGVSSGALVVGSYVYFLTQLFVHLDIDTPRWVGWILQRPEGHRIHHTRGVHAYNYGLPLWDALFGTRRNPEVWDAQYGFWDGASRRVLAMLGGRDVAEPDAAASGASRGPSAAATG
jgi:sterol desaturase/sphingolipid hydroxylase (fatty acid hydroxylase superfamily)